MLNSPVVEMCYCSDFVLVLTASGDVFENGKLNNDEQSFALVESLSSLSITKTSGYAYSALALMKMDLYTIMDLINMNNWVMEQKIAVLQIFRLLKRLMASK